MAAPRKPWERPAVNYRRISPAGGPRLASNNFPANLSSTGQFLVGGGVPTASAVPGTRSVPGVPPPVPPLPQSSYGSPFGNQYGYSPYSSQSSYGMYGSPFASSYGGYGRYGYSAMNPYSNVTDNAFIQMAEESSRPAFESIEAVVHAVGSVSMMLESTYHAMYSSFRAVIGVAHHFSRMKAQFTQMLSAFAVIRSLRWLYRKILYMMGVCKVNPTADEIWSTVSQEMSAAAESLTEGDIKRNRSNWPIIMFMAVVFGAPWVIWRVLISVTGMHSEATKKWISGEGPHYIAVAQFDLVGQSERMLSFQAGQTIRLAPKELQQRTGGWLLGTVDGRNTGLVPTNYIRITRKSLGTIAKQQLKDPVTPTTDPQTLTNGIIIEEPTSLDGEPLVTIAQSTVAQSESPMIAKEGESPTVVNQNEINDQCGLEGLAAAVSSEPSIVAE